MQLVPSWRRRLELGARAEGMVRYKWGPGMAFLPDLGGGICLPQVYCRSVRQIDGEPGAVQFTDDVIFDSESDSLLRLLVLVDDTKHAEAAMVELKDLNLENASQGQVKTDEACFLVLSPSLEIQKPAILSSTLRQRLYCLATSEEFAASELCTNRPRPIGYDMHRMRTETGGKRYVLVRQDRFIFAACQSGQELINACQRISSVLLEPSGSSALQVSKL